MCQATLLRLATPKIRIALPASCRKSVMGSWDSDVGCRISDLHSGGLRGCFWRQGLPARFRFSLLFHRRAGELEAHGHLAADGHLGLEEKGVGQALDQFDLDADRLAGPDHAS